MAAGPCSALLSDSETLGVRDDVPDFLYATRTSRSWPPSRWPMSGISTLKVHCIFCVDMQDIRTRLDGKEDKYLILRENGIN